MCPAQRRNRQDILGNRIGRNSTGYHLYPTYQTWDVLNRMKLFAAPSSGAGYSYPADGQRIEKVEGVTYVWTTTGPGIGGSPSGYYDTNYAQNRPTTRYYHDGQMGFEDDYNPSGTITKVTRNVLGARGIDRIPITENSATTHGYPV